MKERLGIYYAKIIDNYKCKKSCGMVKNLKTCFVCGNENKKMVLAQYRVDILHLALLCDYGQWSRKYVHGCISDEDDGVTPPRFLNFAIKYAHTIN